MTCAETRTRCGAGAARPSCWPSTSSGRPSWPGSARCAVEDAHRDLGLSYTQIAAAMGLTKGRVSQIRGNRPAARAGLLRHRPRQRRRAAAPRRHRPAPPAGGRRGHAGRRGGRRLLEGYGLAVTRYQIDPRDRRRAARRRGGDLRPKTAPVGAALLARDRALDMREDGGRWWIIQRATGQRPGSPSDEPDPAAADLAYVGRHQSASMSPSTSRASTRSARSARSTTWPGTSRSCSPAPGTPRCPLVTRASYDGLEITGSSLAAGPSPGDLMLIATAQLPEPPHGADRIIVTRSAVAVLDGASAFEPTRVPPGEYASRLGACIAAALNDRPAAPLANVLAEAIAATAAALGLADDGGCPSSTVAMARLAGDALDLLALGDSCVFYGTGLGAHWHRDAHRRPARRAAPAPAAALPRAAGRRERLRRRPPGTAARPPARAAPAPQPARRLLDSRSQTRAASHALTLTLPAHAGDLGRARHRRRGEHRAAAGPGRLARARALRPRRPRPPAAGTARTGNRHADPGGREFPRSKRHDDKAIASLITGP